MKIRKYNAIKILFAVLMLSFASCGPTEETVDYSGAVLPTPAVASEKMNGLSFVAPVRPMKGHAYDEVVNTNANWVTLIPYGYGNGDEPQLRWNVDWQWWGEKSSGVKKCVLMAQEQKLKVMVKPQIWFRHGSYTGDLSFDSDAEWELFENSFEGFILEFAEVAEVAKAEAFCLGTEWRNFVKVRPDFWKQLIEKVRKTFSGTLTYAANWDDYQAFPHWLALDLIGIDAYFPLSSADHPTEKELFDGWEPHFNAIKTLSQQTGKPICFTEWGYRSTVKNASEPWDSGKGQAVDMQNQVNAYNATFKRFWNEEWFAGGFIWKWFSKHSESGGSSDNKFTPQNKPAQQTLTEWFGK
jgi:hypothetical protein